MRGRILKFTYKQSKSEELWSAARGGVGEGPHNTAKSSPTQPPQSAIERKHHNLPLAATAITSHQSKYTEMNSNPTSIYE